TTSAATIAAGDAGEVKAPRVDGHSITAEDAANSSRGGGSHHGVLWEGAEDGARQGHHHSRGLDGHMGVLALPDTALIAAVGQRGGAAGLAARVAGLAAGVAAGHDSESQPCGPTPLANSCNECCVRQCQDSHVVIEPSPVVVTLPGPILSSFPQNTAVGSSTSAAVGSILSFRFGDRGGSFPRMLPADLAGTASAATIAVGDAGEVKAPRADGHSTAAEDAANGSGGGGSHGSVLWEGAEDGARQGHHHSRRLNGNVGALALPDTALIAAVGQRAGAAGLAARVAAGHGSGS
ncbi:hypothetical protein Nmel_018344, partial [Mimus melanotis]